MNKEDILLSSLWILTYLSFMTYIYGNCISYISQIQKLTILS